MRKSHRRPKTKFPYSEDLFTDSDFASSHDEGFSVNSLAETLNAPPDDDDARIRDTDHLFEVLLDMFPRLPRPDLQEIWEKHRPNLETAVCHALALSEQQYPDIPDNGFQVMEEDAIWFSEWPDLGNSDDFQVSQVQYDNSYRDCLMRDPDEDFRWDSSERDTSNDNASEASFGSLLSGLSSSVPSSTHNLSSNSPNAAHT